MKLVELPVPDAGPRQSGNSNARMLIYTRLKKSPYWGRSEEHGCYAYSVYNHMYHPRAYVPEEEGGLLKEYEHLTRGVTLWNVAVEHQIQIKGPDALAFTNLLVTRDLARICPVNQARYMILCDEAGGIVNDPVVLRVAEDEFWLSISDSDVLLWARGINCGLGYDVSIEKIDVHPLQIQGPLSQTLMKKLFGDGIDAMRYYGLWRTGLKGVEVIISRTGFSAEIGYEIYPFDSSRHADTVWDAIVEAGAEFGLKVIAPSHIRRLEAGILSYNQDMGLDTNPFEVGLGWQVDFAKPRFIGREALLRVKEAGLTRRLVGLVMGGDPVTWYNPDEWPVLDAEQDWAVGRVTSAFFSPKLGTNIALAMINSPHDALGTSLRVCLPDHADPVPATIVETPFFDSGKTIPKGAPPAEAPAGVASAAG